MIARNQQRLVSHYNVALASLTEEQAEVRTVLPLCISTLTLLSLHVEKEAAPRTAIGRKTTTRGD